MLRLEKPIRSWPEKVNWAAGLALVAMMLLTVVDVILRSFRHPVPGTYEMVGLLGSVVISFSLAYTSVEKGHIAVEVLVRRFSRKLQALISAGNALVAVLLFAVITWRCIVYGLALLEKGEVSLTLEIPIYPFVFGVAVGCGMLCPVLAAASPGW